MKKPSVFKCIIILAALLILFACTSVYAQTSLPDSVYIAQAQDLSCTLASATMMLRAKAYLSNNSQWSSITEALVGEVAWAPGLKYSFTYSFDGNTITATQFVEGAMSLDTVKSLLSQHPEGFVLYCYAGNNNWSNSHAVFVTDCEGDTIYCADPSPNWAGTRREISSSLLGYWYGSQENILNKVYCYWCITSSNIVSDATTIKSNVDSVETGIHTISIKGWAFDEADKTKSIEIRSYLYEGSEVKQSWKTTANKYRSDVNRVHGAGNYHGFDAKLSQAIAGKRVLRIYAFDSTNNRNVLLGSYDVDVQEQTYSGTCGDGLTWELKEDGILRIHGTGTMTDFDGSDEAHTIPWDHTGIEIKKVIIDEGCRNIGKNAFRKTVIESISIPNSVQKIGDDAFRSSRYLTSMTIHQGITDIGEAAFADCQALPAINVSEQNMNYKSIDGVLFSKDQKTLIAYPAGKPDSSYSIPDGVVSLATCAFSYAMPVNVTIPQTVTSIGDYAFQQCNNLTEISLPSSIKELGKHAFEYCRSMKNCEIQTSHIEILKEGTFMNCGLEEIKLPATLANIANEVFYRCENLKSIYIPLGLKTVGGASFAYCQDLHDVYYEGAESDWSAIEISILNEPLTEATKHYQSWTPPESEPEPQPDPVTEAVVSGNRYKLDHTNKTATFLGLKKKNTSKLTIPNKIKVDNKTYIVTGIAANACKGNKKLRTIVIGANINSIGQNAFYKCSNLLRVTIKTKKLTLDSIGKNCFRKTGNDVVYKCPKKLKKNYKKWIVKKGKASKKAKFK